MRKYRCLRSRLKFPPLPSFIFGTGNRCRCNMRLKNSPCGQWNIEIELYTERVSQAKTVSRAQLLSFFLYSVTAPNNNTAASLFSLHSRQTSAIFFFTPFCVSGLVRYWRLGERKELVLDLREEKEQYKTGRPNYTHLLERRLCTISFHNISKFRLSNTPLLRYNYEWNHTFISIQVFDLYDFPYKFGLLWFSFRAHFPSF